MVRLVTREELESEPWFGTQRERVLALFDDNERLAHQLGIARELLRRAMADAETLRLARDVRPDDG